MEISLTAPRNIRSLLEQHGLRLNKRLGQHFLADANILAKIIKAAELTRRVSVLEIGAGIGALTAPLAQAAGHVSAVEIDRGLAEILRATVSHLPNVEIIHADVLELDLASHLRSRPGRWRVVGNLPYSITSPAIIRLLEHRAKIHTMVLMVQKEVADRLLARPGTASYGSLSVLVQAHTDPERIMSVSRTCFFPPPQVDSCVLRLTVRRPPLVPRPLQQTFESVLRAAFGQRRKTLLNALTASRQLGLSRDQALQALAAACVDPRRRGESLGPHEFAALANAVKRVRPR